MRASVDQPVFQNRLVRDLAWVISSPPLVAGEINDTHWWSHQDCLNEYSACLPALKILDQNPAPLITHLEKVKSKRLGLRFEALVAYWIKISPNYKLLEQNIQIIKEGHTFGEMDFIIKEVCSQKVIHLEVAVKFYLGSPPYEDPFHWFGTNTQDQLGKKIAHLKTRQTQLGKTHANYLKERGIEIDKQHCFLKGRLFYPLGFDAPPNGVTSNHLRGRWFKNIPKQNTKLLYPVDKSDWLAEIQHSDINQDLLQTSVEEKDWPRCYIEIEKENSSNELYEVNRLFYLPTSFRFPKG